MSESEYEESPVKRKFARKAKKQLKIVAELLGLSPNQYDLRFNPGGPAVSGEITLHTDWIYIQVSKDCSLGILVRTCRHRKDYTGGPNHWLPLSLLDDPAALLYRLQALQLTNSVLS